MSIENADAYERSNEWHRFAVSTQIDRKSAMVDIYTHIGENFQKEEIDKFNNLTFDGDTEKIVHRLLC